MLWERLKKHFFPNSFDKLVAEWVARNGDKTLRLNYDLNENSIVFDVGGYEGQWASDIFSMYCCTLYVFEPVDAFFQRIERRFNKNIKIAVIHCGLSDRNEQQTIMMDKDGSSLFSERGTSQVVQMKRAVDFIKEHAIEKIDLMKINIEGGEYALLEHLIQEGMVKNIKNIQVQFHNIPQINATERMKSIQGQLSLTHELTYQCAPFVWENWKLKI